MPPQMGGNFFVHGQIVHYGEPQRFSRLLTDDGQWQRHIVSRGNLRLAGHQIDALRIGARNVRRGLGRSILPMLVVRVMMATAPRQVYMMPCAGVLVSLHFLRPMRMMPATPQQQMQGEGDDREEGGEKVHQSGPIPTLDCWSGTGRRQCQSAPGRIKWLSFFVLEPMLQFTRALIVASAASIKTSQTKSRSLIFAVVGVDPFSPCS